MQLSRMEITAIRESLRWLAPEVERVSKEFYADLFRRMPELADMFGENMHAQGMRFMAAVGAIADNLDTPEALDAYVDWLAEAHAPFKLDARTYHHMQEALIDTFRYALGARFTRDMQLAWRSAFGQVAEKMMAHAGVDPEMIRPAAPIA